jgi:hypothetical protein
MISLTFAKDVEYARRSLMKDSKLGGYSIDRYFVAIASPSAELRRYIVKTVQTRAFIEGLAKIDASLIGSIESDKEAALHDASTQNAGTAPSVQSPLGIVYRLDDPLSVRIAEKLFAHLSQHGVPCQLKGPKTGGYEAAVHNNDYDLAVGWVPNSVLSSECERLRLATIWFNDVGDESRRISEAREIPLFAVKRHVLCRNNVGFFKGKLAGIYVRQPLPATTPSSGAAR